MYTPKPIDTSDVELPSKLSGLIEKIAKNVHEVWAEARIKEGWIYGVEKSSKNKTTPCLVEYESLDESEKEYDRKTSEETIKMIIKLGYKIEKDTFTRGIS